MEAGILATVAQVAAGLATGAREVDANLGLVHVHESLPALLMVGLVLAVARLALQVPISYIPGQIASGVQVRLRSALFEAFSRASWSMQASDREGEFQELMSSHVYQASLGSIQATTLVANLFTFLVLLASALVMSASAAGILLVISLGLFALLRPLSATGSRHARDYAEAQVSYAGGISEASRLAEETQVFGVAAAQRAAIAPLVEESRVLFFRTQLHLRIVPGLYQSLVYILLIAGLGAVYEFHRGGVASLGGIVLVLVRAGTYGNQVQNSYQVVRQARPFLDRLEAVTERYAKSAPVLGRQRIGGIASIAFNDVSFAYVAGRPVLDSVSFDVGEGEAIGIIGPSGAGKSTLAQLLLRLRSASTGCVLVNRSPVDAFCAEDWHAHVAYVPQSPNLLHASVADNIRFFREISDSEIEEAGRLARIHDDVISWPDGYATLVGPRADAVSGGQAQRICLARALAGKPRVLLLDEPTSALDQRSEMLIQDSLKALRGAVTLFIIAHRLTTLDVCDRVIVLLNGRVDAIGTAEYLERHNAYYRSVASTADGSTGEPVSAIRTSAGTVRGIAAGDFSERQDVR